jgi:hypothetical protein
MPADHTQDDINHPLEEVQQSKNKRHTLKTENRVTKKGAHRSFGENAPRICKKRGYQGIADMHQNADFPYKSRKN